MWYSAVRVRDIIFLYSKCGLGIAWYGIVYGMVICIVWYGMVCNGDTWCGMVWHGIIWYGMVWCGMAWHGVAWCCMVWYSTTVFTISKILYLLNFQLFQYYLTLS